MFLLFFCLVFVALFVSCFCCVKADGYFDITLSACNALVNVVMNEQKLH